MQSATPVTGPYQRIVELEKPGVPIVTCRRLPEAEMVPCPTFPNATAESTLCAKCVKTREGLGPHA